MAEKQLKLYNNGVLTDATLIYEKSEHPFVQLQSAAFNSEKFESDVLYYCMRKLHGALDSRNMKLLCNGFRYDVHPSGMSISMGQGIKAYKLVMGQPGTELLNIFDATDRLDLIGTVEDQKKYYEEWMKSLQT
jgi:hypothetical protein